MSLNATFFITSALLGLGLAIDGFLISLSNGLNDSGTSKLQILLSAFIFALFQFGAVILGWFCVSELIKYFAFLENVLSYIALVVLLSIGTKMIINGAKNAPKNAKKHNNMQKNAVNSHNTTQTQSENPKGTCAKNFGRKWVITLLIQGIITSVDALSVGFVISGYAALFAIICALIISVITFNMYLIGFKIGKTFGGILGNKAEIIGGIVFILIGIEIFVSSFL